MPDTSDGHDALASQIGHVLRRLWDPIGLGNRGPLDEYDSYVPDLVALLLDPTIFEDMLVAHLARIEAEDMVLSRPSAIRTWAARALLGLREAHSHRSGRLVRQWCSPDGISCVWIFETRNGLYAYEQSVLRHEEDENGRCSWWADAGLGRSGLFDTIEGAEREACALTAWLAQGDIPACEAITTPGAEPTGRVNLA